MMCAWPKGKPRGPRVTVNKNKTEELMAIKKTKKTDDSASTEVEELEEKDSGVIVADTEGFWGFKIGTRDYTVCRRFKHEKDETVVNIVAGEEVIKEIKAGDWSDWRPDKGQHGPYYSTLKQTLNYIKNGMLKAELREKKRLDVFIDAIARSERRIMDMTKGN